MDKRKKLKEINQGLVLMGNRIAPLANQFFFQTTGT